MSKPRETKLAIGRAVTFRVVDIVNVDPMQFFQSANPDLTVQGKIVGFFDSRPSRKAYAMLSVKGLPEYVIVPTSRLKKV